MSDMTLLTCRAIALLASERVELAEHRIEKYERMLKRGVPLRELNTVYSDSLDFTTAPMRKIRSALERKRSMVLLCGNYGVGKSVAAVWAACERDGIYATALEIAELRRTDEDAAKLKRYGEWPCLIIDEFAKGGMLRDYVAPRFFDLLSRRMQSDRLTIVTSNAKSPPELFAAFGADMGGALLDRFVQRGDWCPGEGPSRRAESAEAPLPTKYDTECYIVKIADRLRKAGAGDLPKERDQIDRLRRHVRELMTAADIAGERLNREVAFQANMKSEIGSLLSRFSLSLGNITPANEMAQSANNSPISEVRHSNSHISNEERRQELMRQVEQIRSREASS